MSEEDDRYRSDIAGKGIKYIGNGCLILSVPISALAILLGWAAYSTLSEPYSNLSYDWPDCDTAIMSVPLLPLIIFYAVTIAVQASQWRRRKNRIIIAASSFAIVVMVTIFTMVAYANSHNDELAEICAYR